jgi:hypothetical protein
MSRKKFPLITIGSAVQIAPAVATIAAPIATSVQPSVIERAGDALGCLIWKSAPVVKAVALGVFAAGSGQVEEPESGAPWMDINHPDYLEWRMHLSSH